MSEEIKETPTGELEQGEFKLKKKRGRPKKLTPKQETTKLDLSKKLKESFDNANLSKAFDGELSSILKKIDISKIPANFTTFYKKNWGFCLSENEKKKLPNGKFKVFIDSNLQPGVLNLAEAKFIRSTIAPVLTQSAPPYQPSTLGGLFKI